MTTLTVIPARGGSKGLPGKNIRPFLGLPLLVHLIRCARQAGMIDVVVSTDDGAIAHVARDHGAAVPFLRPAELATDQAGMMPVVEHALSQMELLSGGKYQRVLLLDPTSPGRIPDDIAASIRLLEEDANASGVVAVSKPTFNPYWVGVTSTNGYMKPVFPDQSRMTRRQDLEPFFRINGSLYLWRRDFVVARRHWTESVIIPFEIPEIRAFSIDTLDEFEAAEWLVATGRVTLPWRSA